MGASDILVIVLIADAVQNGMADAYRSITEGLLLAGVRPGADPSPGVRDGVSGNVARRRNASFPGTNVADRRRCAGR